MTQTTEMCVHCDESPATIAGMYCEPCLERMADEYFAEYEIDLQNYIADAADRNAMGADGCPHDDGDLPVAYVNPHPSPYCCCLDCWNRWPSQAVTRPEIFEPRISPFSCGSQFADWTCHNCDRCAKGYRDNDEKFTCDLDYAVSLAYLNDGTVSNEHARRMAYPFGQMAYGWRCGEFVPAAREA